MDHSGSNNIEQPNGNIFVQLHKQFLFKSKCRNGIAAYGSSSKQSNLTCFVCGNVETTVVGASPLAIAVSKATGLAYGIFELNGTSPYELQCSADFVHWTVVNSGILPAGYRIDIGKDLAITNSGTILISATTRLGMQNYTVFEANYDGGRTFATVLNISLIARSVPGYPYSGPGMGFWHGIAETNNGTLFAGIYRPQSLIFKSVNNGRSWSLVFNASAVGSRWQNEIHDIEVDPANNFVYTATDDETGTNNNRTIWVSTDFGNHWKNVYSQLKGGAGLPSIIPDSIGFLGNGGLLTLGLDDHKTRTMYLLQVQPSGDLNISAKFDVPVSLVDPFMTTWIFPMNQNEVLWANLDFSLGPPTLGAGLFTITVNHTLSNLTFSTLYILKGTVGQIGFIQIAGPSASGNYAVLGETNHNLYLIVFRLYLT